MFSLCVLRKCHFEAKRSEAEKSEIVPYCVVLVPKLFFGNVNESEALLRQICEAELRVTTAFPSET
jgi:hypothetical protein